MMVGRQNTVLQIRIRNTADIVLGYNQIIDTGTLKISYFQGSQITAVCFKPEQNIYIKLYGWGEHWLPEMLRNFCPTVFLPTSKQK